MRKKCFAGIFFVLISAVLIGVCGCMNTKYSYEDCIKYLESKYDEKFTYVKPFKDSTMRLYFQSESHPGKNVLVDSYVKDGSLECYDNYVAVIFEDETRKAFEDISKKVYGECKTVYDVSDNEVLPEYMGKNTTFSEFVSDSKANLNFDILLKPGYDAADKEAKLKKVYELLKEKNIVCVCEVYYTNNDTAYSEYDTDSEMTSNTGWFSEHGKLWLDSNCEVKSEVWE